jgi:hypothetical protein
VRRFSASGQTDRHVLMGLQFLLPETIDHGLEGILHAGTIMSCG